MDQTGIGNQTQLEASLQLEAVFRAFPDLLLYVDENGNILDAKAGKTTAVNVPVEQLAGYPIESFLPAEAGPKIKHAIAECIKNDGLTSIEYRQSNLDGDRWFEAHLVPLKETARAIVIIRDISERVRNAEQTQCQLRRLAALHSIDAAITASFDLKVTLAVILRQIINQMGADAADILVLNPNTHMLEYAAGQGFQTKKAQRLPVMIGQGFAGKAALERRTISIPDLGKQPHNSIFVFDLIQEKFANYYAVPLIAKGQVNGVLETYHRDALRPDDDWLDFLGTIAGQTAVAIDSAGLFQDLQRTKSELNLAYDAAIESWAQVLELTKRESETHSARVVELTLEMARTMGIAERELIHFRRGALLHDVGNLGIPESILNKPGPLDEVELQTVQSHPLLAYNLLASVNYLAPAIDIPHYHHERWDGSGYPEGLSEEQIPFPARLFAVVDVYDSLTCDRPYRPAWSHQAAMEHIHQFSGKLFDPGVVRAFSQVMKAKA